MVGWDRRQCWSLNYKKKNWAELCRAQLRLSLLLINQKLASYSLVVSALSSIPGAVNVIN